jgi:aspartokinase/homoserine dehydrogenase 1
MYPNVSKQFDRSNLNLGSQALISALCVIESLVMKTFIHKFGGTSIGSAERMARAANLIAQSKQGVQTVVVVSAMATVTDKLDLAATSAAAGDLNRGLQRIDEIETAHLETSSRLCPTTATPHRDEIKMHSDELRNLVQGAKLLGQLTARARARILSTGEKLSAILFVQALRNASVPATALYADQFLLTDDCFSEANPLAEIADRAIFGKIKPVLKSAQVAVVTGFCGCGPDGATTILGRGGSDLSATYIGAAMNADQVTIWTDVDGVFSSDPNMAPKARVIEQLNYREATEMSFYGAKVLHPRSIIPVAKKGIPIRVKNSFAPEMPGTLVDGRFTPGSHPVKAISAVCEHCLLSVEGKGMSGVPGIAARVFRALAGKQISVTMISQSSSESTICLAVPNRFAQAAEMVLKRVFGSDMAAGDVEEIVVHRDIALIAAVGLGMANTPGVSARVFSSLGKRKVNVLAIAQGSSELNISLAVDRRQVASAVRAMHAEFGLDRLDTGLDRRHGLDLILLGCGKVGRALIDLVLEQRTHVFARFGLSARFVAISDRSGYLLEPSGIPKNRLAEVLAAKTSGLSLAEHPQGIAASPKEMVSKALSYRLARPVLVDVSIADDSCDTFEQAFVSGCDVVTANKKPLADSIQSFQTLLASTRTTGRILKTEATVGAGLPVMDTLEMLLATGDRVSKIEGCLSGTLGYLMGQMEAGQPLSEAVAQAAEAGYTEPDPVTDLAGTDMARKAIILGRLSGLVMSDQPIELQGLVDSSLAGLSSDKLYQELKQFDQAWAKRISEARDQGRVLRYLASIQSETISVRPKEVPSDSPFGMLKGTDNMIVFESERYHKRPLVITGPGAGVDVTAMGVLGDIMRIAADRS